MIFLTVKDCHRVITFSKAFDKFVVYMATKHLKFIVIDELVEGIAFRLLNSIWAVVVGIQDVAKKSLCR